jgi:hypothetical protein
LKKRLERIIEKTGKSNNKLDKDSSKRELLLPILLYPPFPKKQWKIQELLDHVITVQDVWLTWLDQELEPDKLR